MATNDKSNDPRQQRGLEIAKGKRVKKAAGKLWIVPSQSHAGTYVVNVGIGTCSCPDHETRDVKCKHLWAVEYARHRVLNHDGSKVETQTLRVTYTQDWPSYNRAQCAEKEQIQLLLRDLCEQISQPPHTGRGRPPLLLSDVVYGATMKVYTTVSGRRATTDIRECESKGMIEHAPHYNSVFNYLDKPELTLLLQTMIERSAAPLRAIETDFAVDATGFGTSVYRRWYDHKYGREMKEHTWLKCHASVGVVTNVVTAASVTDGDVHDSPQFEGLVQRTAQNFDVHEVSADKAYLSHANLATVEAIGARPFIPFKSNSGGDGSEAWERMFHLFALNRREFLAHYHKRSNSESTFSAIKRKFGGAVRSKRYHAQANEILLKLLCHNLATLVHAMFELGVQPAFAKVA